MPVRFAKVADGKKLLHDCEINCQEISRKYSQVSKSTSEIVARPTKRGASNNTAKCVYLEVTKLDYPKLQHTSQQLTRLAN